MIIANVNDNNIKIYDNTSQYPECGNTENIIKVSIIKKDNMLIKTIANRTLEESHNDSVNLFTNILYPVDHITIKHKYVNSKIKYQFINQLLDLLIAIQGLVCYLADQIQA